jgi:hypothetical protein
MESAYHVGMGFSQYVDNHLGGECELDTGACVRDKNRDEFENPTVI